MVTKVRQMLSLFSSVRQTQKQLLLVPQSSVKSLVNSFSSFHALLSFWAEVMGDWAGRQFLLMDAKLYVESFSLYNNWVFIIWSTIKTWILPPRRWVFFPKSPHFPANQHMSTSSFHFPRHVPEESKVPMQAGFWQIPPISLQIILDFYIDLSWDISTSQSDFMWHNA